MIIKPCVCLSGLIFYMIFFLQILEKLKIWAPPTFNAVGAPSTKIYFEYFLLLCFKRLRRSMVACGIPQEPPLMLWLHAAPPAPPPLNHRRVHSLSPGPLAKSFYANCCIYQYSKRRSWFAVHFSFFFSFLIVPLL